MYHVIAFSEKYGNEDFYIDASNQTEANRIVALLLMGSTFVVSAIGYDSDIRTTSCGD